jgi:subtilisin family serine protease
LNSLRERQEELGFRFLGTIGEILSAINLENAHLADEMHDKFAFLDVISGEEFPMIGKIYQQACVTRQVGKPFPDIAVEPAQPLQYSGAPLGPDYDLRSVGSMHDRYLQLLNTSAANSDGTGVKVAVVDSGFERSGELAGFLDLVDRFNTVEKDNFGHGTAMASIVRDVAPKASTYMVRMSDQEPDVSGAMLGITASTFHYKADIINLSFGLPVGETCPQCGVQTSGSELMRRLLVSVAEKDVTGLGPPILVAATGNNGSSNGFSLPAKWDTAVVAVGSMTENLRRSRFSNYGTKYHNRYIMMPGGEKDLSGNITEWVGEASAKCAGTSAAAAYASGMLALYMSDVRYQNLPRQDFLRLVLGNCQPCLSHDADEHGRGYLVCA